MAVPAKAHVDGDKRTVNAQNSPARKPRRTATGSAAGKQRTTGLSRERILEAVLAHLRADPKNVLSAASAAATVGVTPMAIYRHYASMADLTNVVMSEVLSGIEDEIPADADWRQQVEAWLRAVYRRLEGTPQCVNMLSSTNDLNTGWMRSTAILRTCLQSGGFHGKELTEAGFWITTSLFGYAHQSLSFPIEESIRKSVAALEKLPPEEAEKLSFFPNALRYIATQGLDVIIVRIISALEPPSPR
jgi:AcrR family transcriptional regulator